MKHSSVPLLKFSLYAVLWCGLALFLVYNLPITNHRLLIYPLLCLQVYFSLRLASLLKGKENLLRIRYFLLFQLSGFNSFLLPVMLFQLFAMNANEIQHKQVFVYFSTIHSAIKTYDKYRCEADLLAVRDSKSHKWLPLRTKVLLEGDSIQLSALKPSDCAYAYVKAEAIAQNQPRQKYFLWLKGISQRALMISRPSLVTGSTAFIPELWQQELVAKLNSKLSGFDNQICAVAAAMLLGYRTEISNELNQAYAASGALHVLSVSGMHLGILFYFISKLSALAGSAFSESVYSRLALLILSWLYAALTGFSSSVIRAAMMFSMYLLSLMIDRKADGKNLLVGSLIILICVDPVLLCSIGFQMSYLALAGILWFQPLLQFPTIRSESLPGKFWSLSSAGIAAQLTTTPLAFTYFGQFPVYFLISNLIVAPLGFIIMVSGTILLFLPQFNLFSNLLAWVLGNSVLLLNEGLLILEDLPGSVLKYMFLNLPAAAVASTMIPVLYILLKKFRSNALLYLFGCMLLLQFVLLGCRARVQQKATFIVYSLPPYDLCAFVNRGIAYTVGTIPLTSKSGRPGQVLLKSWADMGVRRHQPATESPGTRNTLFSFHGKTILMMRNAEEPLPAQQADYWVISGTYHSDRINVSAEASNPQKIIFDSSVRSRQKARLMKSLPVKDFEKKLWDVSVKGAFIVDL